MEISGPAKSIGSFLMEMIAIHRIYQRDMVEFCIATICHSWCFPVPLNEPRLNPAHDLPLGKVSAPHPAWALLGPSILLPSHFMVLGSVGRRVEESESRPGGCPPEKE